MLLVLDNLQWCDGETIEWLHYAVKRRPGTGLIVAATLRSEGSLEPMIARFLANLAHGRLSRTIQLGPLGEEATAALAAAVRGERLAADERAAVVRASGGNPLFVIETVNGGRLSRDGTLDVSDRARGAIAAKLEGLEPETLALLLHAAAYGRPFVPTLLARAAGASTAAVENALDELWHRDVIVRRNARYALRHDLIREVIYAGISPVVRLRLHASLARAIAATLSENGHDRAITELAEQCARAERWEEALRHHREAVTQARYRHAVASEVKALRGALEAVSKLPATSENGRTEIELLLDLGLAESASRGWGSAQAERAWSRAQELARKVGTIEHRARALNALDTYYRDAGQWQRCRPLSKAAEALWPRIDDRYLQLCLRSARAALLLHGGHLACSLALYDKVIEHADEIVEPTFRWFNTTYTVGAYFRSAQCLWLLGEIDRAHERAERALQLSETASDPFHRAITLFHVSLLHEYSRDPERVRTTAEELADIAEHHGFDFYRVSAALFLTGAALREGADAGAAQRMRELTDRQHASGTRMFEPYWRTNLAEALLLEGRVEEALRETHAALRIAARTCNRYWTPDTLRLLGDCLHASEGSSRRTADAYRKAVRTARAQGSTVLELRATAAAARALGSTRDVERLGTLHARFEQGRDTRDLRETAALLEGRPAGEATPIGQGSPQRTVAVAGDERTEPLRHGS